jgi:sialidase-1
LLMGLTKHTWPDGTLATLREEQVVYRSRDTGETWEGPFVVPQHPELQLNLNEGDFAEMDDGTVVLYMREDKEGFTGWKSISKDGGRTWSLPFRSQMISVRGRPSVGRLRSGEIAVTYRVASGVSEGLALYVETPAEAVRTKPRDRNNFLGDYHAARFMLIDNDRSLHPDTGYSGWVQLPDGNLYVINYIVDDAPRAQTGFCFPKEPYLGNMQGGNPTLRLRQSGRENRWRPTCTRTGAKKFPHKSESPRAGALPAARGLVCQ